MLRLAFDFIITWRETRTRPNAYDKSTWVKRMLHHLGFVAWGGCGFMGPTMGKIEGVLPNAGVGLRIEVQPRMNVRLDFGRNFANDQSLFYFNMTEAF